jgi:hypothetical protein
MLGKRISFPQKTVREKKQEYIKKEMDMEKRGRGRKTFFVVRGRTIQLPVSHFVACCQTRKEGGGGWEEEGRVFF